MGSSRSFVVKGMQHGMGQAGIIQGAVPVGDDAAERDAEGAQVVAAVAGQSDGSQFVGIDDLVILEDIVALQEGEVKAHIVPDDGVIPARNRPTPGARPAGWGRCAPSHW